jgi:hypothetical protein
MSDSNIEICGETVKNLLLQPAVHRTGVKLLELLYCVISW